MIYAIGDIQGCFTPFQQLLDVIAFNPDRDQLWLAGDLINRGPESLQTLEYCYAHRDNIIAVLGNHDLHLLALATLPERKPGKKDTLNEILAAPQKDAWLSWLRHNPLLHWDTEANAAMSHAGIAPFWDLTTARARASEVEALLRQDDPALHEAFFRDMYGNEPDLWDDALEGTDRLRTITNYFTRMRVVDAQGRLNLRFKKGRADIPHDSWPWFEAPQRVPIATRLLFGHWAALLGDTKTSNIIGLDLGCVWGNQLGAYCLDTQEWYYCQPAA